MFPSLPLQDLYVVRWRTLFGSVIFQNFSKCMECSRHNKLLHCNFYLHKILNLSPVNNNFMDVKRKVRQSLLSRDLKDNMEMGMLAGIRFQNLLRLGMKGYVGC